MTVLFALAYTIAALVAVGLHAVSLREARSNQSAIRRVPDGLGQEVASMVVRIEGARLAKAVLIAALGVGILVGYRAIGWVLIPIPLIGIWATWRDLESRKRQAVLAAKLLSDAAEQLGVH